MVKIVNHRALIEERKQTEAYIRNKTLLDQAYVIQRKSDTAWSGAKWLCSEVSQMADWLKLVPQGLDYLALEIVYLSDGAISIIEPTLPSGEVVGERFREWLNYNECSVFMQHRRDIVIPILRECSGGRVISMASGSALVEIAALSDSHTELICVDKSDVALARALALAALSSMPIEIVPADLLAFDIAKLQPDVIYSIGFLGNYLTKQQIAGILARWLPVLKSGGKLITDYISLDAETEKCLTEIVGWPVARTDTERGLRLYDANSFADILTSSCANLDIAADIRIDDYQYGGVATVTVL